LPYVETGKRPKSSTSGQKIHRKTNKLNLHKNKNKPGELVLYGQPPSRVDVILDEETLRV